MSVFVDTGVFYADHNEGGLVDPTDPAALG
jgi:hypothetical protein